MIKKTGEQRGRKRRITTPTKRKRRRKKLEEKEQEKEGKGGMRAIFNLCNILTCRPVMLSSPSQQV